MTESHAQPRPRCFYCDTVLTDEQAKIAIPGGHIYGPCCGDIAPADSPAGRR